MTDAGPAPLKPATASTQEERDMEAAVDRLALRKDVPDYFLKARTAWKATLR